MLPNLERAAFPAVLSNNRNFRVLKKGSPRDSHPYSIHTHTHTHTHTHIYIHICARMCVCMYTKARSENDTSRCTRARARASADETQACRVSDARVSYVLEIDATTKKRGNALRRHARGVSYSRHSRFFSRATNNGEREYSPGGGSEVERESFLRVIFARRAQERARVIPLPRLPLFPFFPFFLLLPFSSLCGNPRGNSATFSRRDAITRSRSLSLSLSLISPASSGQF